MPKKKKKKKALYVATGTQFPYSLHQYIFPPILAFPSYLFLPVQLTIIRQRL
jgi:hypothetical protein